MNIRKAARNPLPFLRHRMPSDVKPRRRGKRASGGGAHRTPRGEKNAEKNKKKKRKPKKYHQYLRMSEILTIFAQNLEVQQIFGRF